MICQNVIVMCEVIHEINQVFLKFVTLYFYDTPGLVFD